MTPLKCVKAPAELLPQVLMNCLTKVKDCCKNGNAQPYPNILMWDYWQCLRDMALGGRRLRAAAGAGTTTETTIYGGGDLIRSKEARRFVIESARQKTRGLHWSLRVNGQLQLTDNQP